MRSFFPGLSMLLARSDKLPSIRLWSNRKLSNLGNTDDVHLNENKHTLPVLTTVHSHHSDYSSSVAAIVKNKRNMKRRGKETRLCRVKYTKDLLCYSKSSISQWIFLLFGCSNRSRRCPERSHLSSSAILGAFYPMEAKQPIFQIIHL